MRRMIALAALCLMPADVNALDVVLDAHIQVSGDLKITARTNLPEQTRMSVSVFNEASNYYLKVDAVVRDGKIESGPLNQFGQPLAPGAYTSEIATEPVQFQPDSVLRVIGSRGEQLQGTLVQRGMLGRRVYFRECFTLR